MVVDDICASGGYYVAAAADKIYVDKASLIGSIGVLMDGFGFTGTMAKLGVERRLITAGANKGFLDPFSPLNPEQTGIRQTDGRGNPPAVHRRWSGQGRGKRLKETPDTFSGLVWNGQRGVEMGLADGYGTRGIGGARCDQGRAISWTTPSRKTLPIVWQNASAWA